MKLRLASLALCYSLLAAPSLALAHDRVVHYDIVFATAVANGFSPDDAALIARASQGLDDNISTTAFDWAIFGKEAIQVKDGLSPADLDHTKEGQAFHALTRNRALVEAAHIDRIQKATGKLRLIYLGQYLHFVSDSVVHPEKPTLGHFAFGHIPDRADLDYERLRATVNVMSHKLHDFQLPGSPLKVSTQQDLKDSTRPIATDNRALGMLEGAMLQVRDSWTGAGHTHGHLAIDLYSDDLAGERQGRASAAIDTLMRRMGYQYRSYTASYTMNDGPEISLDRIETDQNGVPLSDEFGQRDPLQAAFAARIAAIPEMAQERKDDLREIALLGADLVNPTTDIYLPWASLLDAADKGNDWRRKLKPWRPPSSPGGIALDPALQVPLERLGEPKYITCNGNRLQLVTTEGTFEIDGVGARSFAMLARTIAAGQIPWLSIGSQASGRDGYARVTLSPMLHSTEEGRALYDADVQFKTIFAHLPLSREQIDAGLQDLLAGFPGNGGDLVRFWITSSKIRLELDGRRLLAADHGMQINAETQLRGAVVEDALMQDYANRLTRDWTSIAEAVPEFRRVESLALGTALVLWARKNHVAIDPMVLLIPPRYMATPDYAPIVAEIDRGVMMSGGVTLTPEGKGGEIGRALFSSAALALSEDDAKGGFRWGRVLFAVEGSLYLLLCCLFPAFLLWGIWRKVDSRFSIRRAATVWTATMAASFVLIGICSPLVLGDRLSAFDRDFLALLSTFPSFLVVLYAALRRWGPSELAGAWRRRATFALGLAGPLITGVCGLGLVHITLAVSGPVPPPLIYQLLTLEMSPLVVSTAAVATPPGEHFGWMPAPESVLESGMAEYERDNSNPGLQGDVIDFGTQSASLPASRLRKVSWPQGRGPAMNSPPHYTPDGKPPF